MRTSELAEFGRVRSAAGEAVLRTQLGARQELMQEVKEGIKAEAVQMPELRQGGPAAETAPRQVLAPEVRSALVQALEVRAEAIPEYALTPEIRQVLREMQLIRQKLAEINELLKTPQGVMQLVREELPERKQRFVIPTVLLTLQAETPQYVKPWTRTLKTPEDEPKYSPPLLTTATTPTAVTIPSPPTYTPVTVPKISEVPTVDVPSVPTYDTGVYKRLPSGWWRLLPPSMFVEDAREGAYRVQEGKRQILALA